MPSTGSYAFLLKLSARTTATAFKGALGQGKSAARSAARAYALADSDAAGREQARVAIRQALADQGGSAQAFTFDVSCGGGPCHQPGAVITVRVWSGVNLPMLPAVLGGDAPSFRLDSTHTVPVGQFRDLG